MPDKIKGCEDLQIYHIALNEKHRLFGYKDDDNVFHVILNDPNHEFDKL